MTKLKIKIWVYALATSLLGGLATPAFAGSYEFEQCRQVFANDTPPVIQHQDELIPRALCFNGFAVLHSGKSHAPIYAAERLSREALLNARHKKRTNKFFADARLPRSERAELEDYHYSNYDRGHMAPAADMASDEAMAQCFSLEHGSTGTHQ